MPMRTLDREGALAVASGSERRPATTTASEHGEKTTADEGHKQESHTRSVSEPRGRCSGVTREHSRRRECLPQRCDTINASRTSTRSPIASPTISSAPNFGSAILNQRGHCGSR